MVIRSEFRDLAVITVHRTYTRCQHERICDVATFQLHIIKIVGGKVKYVRLDFTECKLLAGAVDL